MRIKTTMDVLCALTAATSIDETWKIATDHLATLGFARINYGYTRFRHQRSIGDPDDALFLTTCSNDYVQAYFDSGFYARTPIFRWAERNTGACTWKWVREAMEKGELCPEEQAAVLKNKEIGIKAGITVSFLASSIRSKGAIGLIADPGLSEEDVEKIFVTLGKDIIVLANMMHLRILQLPQLSRTRALSPRQREALEWVADGKTTQDVALLMGVSTAMVEKHLRLAREALAVETTAQAVAKSTALNMIFNQPHQG